MEKARKTTKTPVRITLKGTPGIGKTFFGFYLLHQLIAQGRRVVYRQEGHDPYIFFKDEALICPNPWAFQPSDVLIADSVRQLPLGPVDTLLITSPDPQVAKIFQKEASTIYCPTWDLDELLACNRSIHGREEAHVKNLYDQWGGIPRYVLQHSEEETKQTELAQALQLSKPEKLIEALNRSSSDPDLSHKLIHMQVVEGVKYSNVRYQFASKYIADKVIERLVKTHKQSIYYWLAATAGASALAGIRGLVFEQHAHERLAQGGTFKIRELVDHGNETTLALEAREKAVFVQLDEIEQLDASKYAQPLKGNQESIDSLILPNMVFQFTVSLSHPVKQAGLVKAYKAMGLENPPSPKKRRGNEGGKIPIDVDEDKIPRLYFVVPEDIFDQFRSQPFHDNKSRVVQGSGLVASTRQFALSISFSNRD